MEELSGWLKETDRRVSIINKDEINALIAMYNKARRTYRQGNTTTDVQIIFDMKDSKEIAIQGNPRSYQYVYVNEKCYKI